MENFEAIESFKSFVNPKPAAVPEWATFITKKKYAPQLP
jgi:hypothetical protein